jgi:hypothetical protein
MHGLTAVMKELLRGTNISWEKSKTCVNYQAILICNLMYRHIVQFSMPGQNHHCHHQQHRQRKFLGKWKHEVVMEKAI